MFTKIGVSVTTTWGILRIDLALKNSKELKLLDSIMERRIELFQITVILIGH